MHCQRLILLSKKKVVVVLLQKAFDKERVRGCRRRKWSHLNEKGGAAQRSAVQCRQVGGWICLRFAVKKGKVAVRSEGDGGEQTRVPCSVKGGNRIPE